MSNFESPRVCLDSRETNRFCFTCGLFGDGLPTITYFNEHNECLHRIASLALVSIEGPPSTSDVLQVLVPIFPNIAFPSLLKLFSSSG